MTCLWLLTNIPESREARPAGQDSGRENVAVRGKCMGRGVDEWKFSFFLALNTFFSAMLCELRGLRRVKYGNVVIPMKNGKPGRTCLLSHQLDNIQLQKLYSVQ
jgi:hypothetical protein